MRVSLPYLLRLALAAALALLFQSATVVQGQQPSFNCATDTHPDERTICTSSVLSQLDRQMDALYNAARESVDGERQLLLRDAQRNWLRQRAACGANANCIAGLYRTRIAQLQTMLAGPTLGPPLPGPPSSPPPTTGTPAPPPAGGGGDACAVFPTLC